MPPLILLALALLGAGYAGCICGTLFGVTAWLTGELWLLIMLELLEMLAGGLTGVN